MNLKYLSGVVLFAVMASTSVAQFTPVVSRVKQTDETLNDGKVIKSVQREAMYYRKTDGSYVFQWVSMLKDGETQQEYTGAFWDNKTGTSYRLDYQNKKAFVEDKGKLPIQPSSSNADATEKGYPQDSVHGITCRVHPVKMHTQSGDISAGQVCVSNEHHLLLRQELAYPTGNNQSTHTLIEFYDVQLGAEPDPKVFEVSRSFTIFEPSAQKN